MLTTHPTRASSAGSVDSAPARPRGGRSAAGFTLTELLITVAVLGILTGVSAPYVLRENPAAASRAADTLAQSMRLARFRAISTDRQVYIHVEPNGIRNFYTAYVNLGDPAVVPTGTAAEISATGIEFADYRSGRRGNMLPTNVKFGIGSATKGPDGKAIAGPITLPTNRLVFDSRGAVQWPSSFTAESGAIYIQTTKSPVSVRAITISRAGQVKVWQLTGGTWQ